MGNTTPLALCSFFLFFSVLFCSFYFRISYVSVFTRNLCGYIRVFILSMFTEVRECQVPGYIFKKRNENKAVLKLNHKSIAIFPLLLTVPRTYSLIFYCYF